MFFMASSFAATDTPCCVLEAPLDEQQAEMLAHQLKALADPVRLRLVSMIATSPTGTACACDLPDAVGKSQPTVSHHLTQLVNAGVLERQQRGKWAWFRLSSGGLDSIRSALGENARHHHTGRPAVLFVGEHDAGWSQIAAGFMRAIAGDRIDVCSAGSTPGDRLDPVVIEAMGERDIDISTATPQVWTDDMARAADVVVTIGCDAPCPIYPGRRAVDWELGDPAGQDIEMVRDVRDRVEQLVTGLIEELTPHCCG